MFPLFFLAILSLVSLSSAGPACTRKYYKTAQCIEKCNTRWGFPGTMMGTNPWGQVMQVVDDDTKATWNTVIAEACGMAGASSSTKGKLSDDSDTDISGSLDDDEEPIVEETSVDDDQVVSTFKTSATPSSFRTAAFAPPPKSSSAISSSSVAPKKTTKPAPKQEDPDPAPAQPKTTSKKTTPAPTPAPGNSGNSGNQGGDIGQYLKAHNDVRARHGASPLTWSDKLASAAQKWANNCKFVHSGGAVGPFGENLAAGTGSSFSIASAVGNWAAEVKDYKPNAPVASHFTQVVWKDTTQVGCAVAQCSGIFDAKFGKASYHVCEYDPPGNFNNDFARNVQV